MLSEFQKASSLVFNTAAPGFLISDVKFLQKTLIFFLFLFNLNNWQQQRPLPWDRKGGCRQSSLSVLSGAAAAASPVAWHQCVDEPPLTVGLFSSSLSPAAGERALAWRERASERWRFLPPWSMTALCPLLCCLLQCQRAAESQLAFFCVLW